MTDRERFERLRTEFDALVDLVPADQQRRLADLARRERELAAELGAMLATVHGDDGALDRPAIRGADDLVVTPRIPGYRIESRLGRGGSATVYRARQERESFSREVALKVIDRGSSEAGDRRAREEQQILASLEHPGIARLYDAGVSPAGQIFLAMERVDGTDLLTHCRDRALPVRDRVLLFAEVLDAVAFAHRHGVVHRDLKPGNILVTADGTPKLLDFGIAKRSPRAGEDRETRTGHRAMTLSYASPEQVRGESVTVASDVYSLGVVLYELLAEVPPYRLGGERFELVEDAIRLQDPEAPSSAVTRALTAEAPTSPTSGREELVERRRALRGDLDAVVLRALRKEPTARYASTEELAAELRRFLAGEPVAARAADRRYRVGRWLRRRARLLATAMILLAAMAMVALSAWRERRATPFPASRAADEIAVFHGVEGVDRESRDALRAAAEALAAGDASAARDRFTRAAQRLAGVPERALALDGLSRAEAALGEVGRSRAAARLAAQVAPGVEGLEGERIAARARVADGAFDVAVPALDRLVARLPERVDLGVDLVLALLASGQTDAAAATLARVEQLPSQARPELRDPRLDLAEADVAFRLGEQQRAAAAAIRARDGAEARGMAALRVRADRRRAESIARLGLPDEAMPELERVARAADALGLARESAAARLGLAKGLAQGAEVGPARQALESARAALAAAGDGAGESEALAALALVAAKQRDFATARHLARRAVERAQEIRDRWSEGEALAVELKVLNWADDGPGVLEVRERALDAMRDSGNRLSLLELLNNLAVDAADRRELERAEALLDEADALARRVDGRLAGAGLDRARGYLDETRGEYERARQGYERAVEKARRSEAPVRVATYLADLAWLEVAADRPDAAQARAVEAMAAHRAVGRLATAEELAGILAWVDARRGDRASAERRLADLPKEEEPTFARVDLEASIAEALADWPRAIAKRRELAAATSVDGVRIEQNGWLARDLAAAGELAEARRLARTQLVEAERLGLSGVARSLRTLLAHD